MITLKSQADVKLDNLPAYLASIEDRLHSFQARSSRADRHIEFVFPFGLGRFDIEPGRLRMSAHAPERDGLARVKDLLATAVQVYAKAEAPVIRWQGDLADETRLAQFREMTVTGVSDLTARMKRVRLAGDDLERFARFGGMHVRVLFPTKAVPEPEWPTLGANGLAAWPPEHRWPTPRAYTIRRLDVENGWMHVDFLIHAGESVGSRWAEAARPGMKIGIMGPVGRPVPMDAQWYVLGADETGLPALSRMLETLPPATRGMAFVEVADAAERQAIDNRTGIELHWLYRDDAPAGQDDRLARAVLAVEWPRDLACFGWFASEAEPASLVRDTWRSERRLGRDQTLTATYWRRGASGFMAG